MTFEELIQTLGPVSIADVKTAMAEKQTATYFMGRTSCPYCHRLAGSLTGLPQEKLAKISFIYSDDLADFHDLLAFRKEHQIPTVPALLHLEQGNLNVRCDSSMSLEEIVDFAQL